MRLATAFSVLVSLVTSACQGENSPADDLVVETEANPALDFAAYTRFTVIDPIELLYEDPPDRFADANGGLLAAIEEDMVGVGLIPDEDNAQLAAAPFVAIEPNDDFVAGYFGYYWGYDFTWARELDHEPGTLVIDVVDVGMIGDLDDDVLAFRAVIANARGDDPESLKKILRRGIDEAFEEWPQ